MKITNQILLLTASLLGVKTAAQSSCKQSNGFALSFDEGPIVEGNYTSRVLDELKSANVTATFHFVLEYMSDPMVRDLAVRALNEGHTIGYRIEPTWNLTSMTDEDFQGNMTVVKDFFKNNFKRELHYVRLPYRTGDYSKFIPILESLGCRVTEHNVDSKDYDSSVDVYAEVKSRCDVLDPSKDSVILVQRCISENSVGSVPKIIEYAKSRGWILQNMETCVDKVHSSPAPPSGPSTESKTESKTESNTTTTDTAKPDESSAYLPSFNFLITFATTMIAGLLVSMF